MGVGEDGIQGNFKAVNAETTTPDFTTGGVITSEENIKYMQKLEVNDNFEGQPSQLSGKTTGSTGPYAAAAAADTCVWCCCFPVDCCFCCCCTDTGSGDCDCGCCECGDCDCDCGGCDGGGCDAGGCDCGGC